MIFLVFVAKGTADTSNVKVRPAVQLIFILHKHTKTRNWKIHIWVKNFICTRLNAELSINLVKLGQWKLNPFQMVGTNLTRGFALCCGIISFILQTESWIYSLNLRGVFGCTIIFQNNPEPLFIIHCVKMSQKTVSYKNVTLDWDYACWLIFIFDLTVIPWNDLLNLFVKNI